MRTGTMMVLGALLWAASGCEEVEVILDQRRDMTAHEAYVQGLHDAGLAGTALSRDWLREAGRALQEPLRRDAPFVEEGYLTPEDPMAVGYRFALERGQTATVTLAVDAEETGRIFFDLLRVAEDETGNSPRPVDADTTDIGFVFEPNRDGEFILRVQPELLRGGAYRIEVRLDAAFAFPVEGRGMDAAWSRWGAPRDGGRRSHEGIDIFAPRGTPVLAAIPGRIRRVGTSNLGGKVVWLRDDRQNRDLYYAHLDSQYVAEDRRVEIGDTLGFVGNTGNARTTPPHLHFGVYYRGPGGRRRGGEGAVNPALFLRPVTERAIEVDVDRAAWGRWVRIRGGDAELRESPSRRAEVAAELADASAVRVLGGAGAYYRVRLPDGRSGYVAARRIEPLEDPVAHRATDGPLDVVSSPAATAPRITRLVGGTDAAVFGRWGDFELVRPESGGPFGWVRRSMAGDTDD